MREDRYIKVEEDVYIDTIGGLSPHWRALLERLIVYGIGALILGSLAYLLLPTGSKSREAARSSSCQSNLKQLGLAISQYTQDYDTRYPLAKGGDRHYSTDSSGKQPYGWADAIQPYVKSTSLLICPCAPRPHPYFGDPGKIGFTTYWYNRKLAHATAEMRTSPTATFMLGDGMAGNASNSLDAFPVSWQVNETSPLWRHLDGANYAFADGHVKWLDTRWPEFADTQQYHFSLK